MLKDQELYIKHFQDHIVKKADTIEELCDEFVVKMDGECITRRTLLELRDMVHYVQAIYGAIWTDKGLIYVAKMNDKGEFELLWQEEL